MSAVNCARHLTFRQADESAPCARPLRLSLIYGDDVTRGYLRPAWTDVQLLDCFEGIGINDWKVLATTAGEHVLRFDGAPLCDVCFEFKRRLGGRVIAEVSAEEGSAEVVIPQSVVRLIDARKTVIIEMSPSDWFGDPQHEYATRFTLRR